MKCSYWDLNVHCLTFDSLKCSTIYFQPVYNMRPLSSPSSPTRGANIPCLRCMWDYRNNSLDPCLYINLSKIVVLTPAIADAGVRIYTSSFTNYDWPQNSSLQVYAASLMGCVRCAQSVLRYHAAQDTKKMSETTNNAEPYIYERLSIYLKWKCRWGGAEVAQPGVFEVVLNHNVPRSTSWIQSVWYIRSLGIPM